MLSRTVEYALRAMVHLASLPGPAATSSQSVADHTLVPKDYLSKILRSLANAGLVASSKGPTGGFVLAKPAGSITILDVVNAVEPIKRIDRCPLGVPGHVALCPLHRKLDDAYATFERAFASTTLGDLLAAGLPHQPAPWPGPGPAPRSRASRPACVRLTASARTTTPGPSADPAHLH